MSLAEQCQKLCDKKICPNECCGIVPFPVELFNKYAYRAGVKKWDKTELMENKEGKRYVTAVTKDLSCIFLKDKCTIYEERPEVCRKFGDESHKMLKCPYLDKNGKRRKNNLE